MTRRKRAQPPFPLSGFYARLRAPPGDRVREAAADGRPFAWTERHLQCVWYDAALRPDPLLTPAGETVRVESPGQWNLEAGPDFLDAAVLLGPERRRVRGDVEVHVSPQDWVRHGHGADPAYRGVRVHVTYHAGALPSEGLPPGAVQISLDEPLRRDPAFAFESVDVTAYPYSVPSAVETPCRRILAGRTPADHALLLDAAGQERLRQKSLRLAQAVRERGEAQAVYEEVLCALGYRNNKSPFRLLARRVPRQALSDASRGDPARAYALLLGVAGLIPRKPSPRWDAETRAFVRLLWDHWWRLAPEWEGRTLARDAWRLTGQRPHNHPVRRLAAAAGWYAGERDPVAAVLALPRGDPDRWRAEVGRLLCEADAVPYWARRLSFAGSPQALPAALVGPDRIAAIVANVFVPLLAVRQAPLDSLLAALPPEQDSGLVRRMAHTLLGPDHNPALYRTGVRQQGLIQVFHDFCLANRADCSRCALPAALSALS